MAAENVSFLFPTHRRSNDWTSHELAEFYRVEGALIQGGMRIITDRGLSDEGDPWFVFCREDSGEPVVHFARIDGQYIIASPAYEGVARGLDFKPMVRDLISRHKLAPVKTSEKSNIFMHPAALLIVLVGVAFFKTPSEAQASEAGKGEAPGAHVVKGAFLDIFGREPEPLSRGGISSEAYDQQEMALKMSQLVLVAASAIFVLDETQAPQAADNHAAPFELGPDYGKERGQVAASAYSPIVPLNLEGVDTIRVDENGSLYAGGANWPGFDSVVSATSKSMTESSQIQVVNSDNIKAHSNLFTEERAVGSSTIGHNYEITLLAEKTAATAHLGEQSFNLSLAQTQTQNNVAGGINLPDSGGVYHESAVVIDKLPASFQGLISIESAGLQPGSARNYLVENKIFVSVYNDKSSGVSSPSPSVLISGHGAPEVSSNFGQTVAHGATVSGGGEVLTSSTSGESLTSTVFLKTLDLFLQETPKYGVYIVDDTYVFFDASIVKGSSATMETLHMTFNDMSSISIVGQASVLDGIIHHLQ